MQAWQSLVQQLQSMAVHTLGNVFGIAQCQHELVEGLGNLLQPKALLLGGGGKAKARQRGSHHMERLLAFP